MSVSSTTTKNSHSGNGSTTAFAYGFKIFADADLEVIIRASTGAETTKTLTTHYTVAGAGNDSGGTVTFTTGNTPASGETVVIRRKLTLTQGTDYVENDPFPADSHEDGLDRLTFIAQGIQEELDRSFKVSKTNSITTPEFVDDASTRASKLLGFSSDGNTLEATTGRVNTVSVSAVSAGGTPTASFNTTTGALALGVVTGNTGAQGPAGDLDDPTTTQHDIIVRGASAVERLAKGSNSTVLNTNASGALAYSTVTTAMIADDAVSSAKIADDAVTLAKMASGTDGNLISFDTSGNPAYVSTGSANQVLTSNGAGAAPTFQTAAGGSLVHITTVTASNSASIDIASTLTDTYNSYFVTFANLLPASNNTEFVMLFSTDNGSSFVTGSSYVYNIKHFYVGPSGDGNSESTGDSSIRLALAVSSTAADGGLSGYMYIHSPTNSAVRTHVNFASFMKMGDGSNTAASLVGGGYVGSATDDDAFQIKNESGNITSGTVRVYGIANS